MLKHVEGLPHSRLTICRSVNIWEEHDVLHTPDRRLREEVLPNRRDKGSEVAGLLSLKPVKWENELYMQWAPLRTCMRPMYKARVIHRCHVTWCGGASQVKGQVRLLRVWDSPQHGDMIPQLHSEMWWIWTSELFLAENEQREIIKLFTN